MSRYVTLDKHEHCWLRETSHEKLIWQFKVTTKKKLAIFVQKTLELIANRAKPYSGSHIMSCS
jgi:hypothetical protein